MTYEFKVSKNKAIKGPMVGLVGLIGTLQLPVFILLIMWIPRSAIETRDYYWLGALLMSSPLGAALLMLVIAALAPSTPIDDREARKREALMNDTTSELGNLGSLNADQQMDADIDALEKLQQQKNTDEVNKQN